MRAIGVHTYFGGFHIGLATRGEVITSGETWEPGIKGRRLLGLDTTPLDKLRPAGPRLDLVFGNPPCSRYSTMATQLYSDEQKASVDLFDELGDLVNLTLAGGASALWWETGPVLWSKGGDMVRAIHQTLRQEWGRVTTAVVRYDLRYGGLPQRRPRVHLLHLRGRYVPPAAPPPRWPPEGSVYDWVRAQGAWSGPGEVFLPPGAKHYPPGAGEGLAGKPVDDVMAYVRWFWDYSKYMANRHRSVGVRELYTVTVVPFRYFAWEEENRWWGTDEYAAIMGYPLGPVAEAAEELGPSAIHALLGKSVSPRAAQDVYDLVLTPTLDGVRPKPGPDWRLPVQVAPDIWYLDLGVGDTPFRRAPYHK